MPDRLSRRALLSGLGCALLTSCSDGPPRPPAAPPAATVTAATGPVVVPAAPLRVVVLGPAELDSAMTLGVTPVGAAQAPGDGGLPDYWPRPRLAEIAGTGTIGSPDLRAIGELHPELILGSVAQDGAHLDALQQIAPTVLTTTAGYPWKNNFQLHAQALGREAQAAAVTRAYAQHAGRAAQAIAAVGAAGRKISLLHVSAGSVRLSGRQSFLGTVLADLQLGTDREEIPLAPDQLPQADGDYLCYAPDSASGVLRAAAQWPNLPAVRAHRAFPVDDRLWFQGIGYTAANLIIAELQHLLGA